MLLFSFSSSSDRYRALRCVYKAIINSKTCTPKAMLRIIQATDLMSRDYLPRSCVKTDASNCYFPPPSASKASPSSHEATSSADRLSSCSSSLHRGSNAPFSPSYSETWTWNFICFLPCVVYACWSSINFPAARTAVHQGLLVHSTAAMTSATSTRVCCSPVVSSSGIKRVSPLFKLLGKFMAGISGNVLSKLASGLLALLTWRFDNG